MDIKIIENALKRAYLLGQQYWQQADSEYISQNRKADETEDKFIALVAETLKTIETAPAVALAPVEPIEWKHDCAALLINDVVLWIPACPHCGKPRTVPSKPAPDKCEPSGREVLRTIWTHHSAQAETTPWTAMYIFDEENPFDLIAKFGEMAGQKYGNTEIEAIAALIGKSERPAPGGCDPQKSCVSGGCPNKKECDSAQYCLYTAKKHEPMQDEQSEKIGDLMWATAKMREREAARIEKIVGVLEHIKREKMAAINADNDDLTIAYMTGYHAAKKEPYTINNDLIDFVKYVKSLRTGGLLQSKAEALLTIMEGGNG